MCFPAGTRSCSAAPTSDTLKTKIRAETPATNCWLSWRACSMATCRPRAPIFHRCCKAQRACTVPCEPGEMDDCPKPQTAIATPAEPGDLPLDVSSGHAVRPCIRWALAPEGVHTWRPHFALLRGHRSVDAKCGRYCS